MSTGGHSVHALRLSLRGHSQKFALRASLRGHATHSNRTTSAGAIRAVLQSTLQPMELRASSSPPAGATRLRRPPPARLRRHSSPPAGAPLSTIEICLPWVHWVHDEYANAQLDVNRGPRCQLLRNRAACDDVFELYGEIGDIPGDVLIHDRWSVIAGFCTDGF